MEQAEELCHAYRSFALRLASLSVPEPSAPWEPKGLLPEGERVAEERRVCRAEAKALVRRLFIVGETWGLDVEPLLDVLAELGRDTSRGDAGMLGPPARPLLHRIEARAGVEIARQDELGQVTPGSHGRQRDAETCAEPVPPGSAQAAASRVPGHDTPHKFSLRPASISAAEAATAQRKDAARERLVAAYRRQADVIVVHYSCGRFGTGGEPTTIGCIVAKRLRDDAVTVFDARDGGEPAALSRFHDYAQAALPSALWLNWNMRDQQFGFEAIARRARAVGAPDVEVPASKRIDLKRLFNDIYGDNYAGHPRLQSLIRLNGITDRGLLDERQAACAFATGDLEALLASALRKVHAIDDLFRRAAEGRLRTLAAPGEPAGKPGNGLGRRAPKRPSSRDRGGIRKTPGRPLPELIGKPKMVYDILRKLPKGAGLTGKQLVQKMPHGESLELSTLTRHIIPLLRPHGVTNSPGVGYHIDRSRLARSACKARK